MNTRSTFLTLALTGGLLAPAAPAAAQPERDDRESYSYVRTLDGAVTVAAPGEGPGEAAEVNQPLRVGDELRLDRGARAEVLLADRNLLRLDGGSTLSFERIAYSADRDDRSTALSLTEGELLLVVTDSALGDELPEIRTPSAQIYVHEPGTYRVEAAGEGWTELLVREGYAEMVTQRGSTIVRAGELARLRGDAWGRVELVAAGPEDALERWDQELHERATVAARAVPYVEPELAYAAAPLADYGSWIEVDASWYWRPRVASGWRPYWQGRWCSTPSGLTWVSNEPWGWVPYHYGTWVIAPGYGWVWRPGRVYSPAWVYWSWGDRWAGWCPVGYYTGFYHPWYDRGFRWGIYGWAGGGWGFYADWNFVPNWCVRNRDWRPHHRTGRDLEREGRHGEGPHGVITTDTRLITRDRLERPERIPIELAEQRRREGGGEAPDVTDFVARKRELSPKLIRAIEEPNDPGRLAGTPLAPDTPKGGVASRRPTTDQPWRRGSDDAPVGTLPGRGVGSTGTPRAVKPAIARDGRVAVEDGAPTRALPSRPAADGEPRALPRSTPRADTPKGTPSPGSDPRQGWKARREPGTAAQPRSGQDDAPATLPRGGTRFEDSPRRDSTPPTVDRKEPVQRVVGGVRRTPVPGGSPKSSPSAPTTPRTYEPRSYDTPSAPKTYTTPSTPRSRDTGTQATPPRSTPRTYSAPATPRSRDTGTQATPKTYQTPSTPRAAPAPRTGSGSGSAVTPRGSSSSSSGGRHGQSSSSPKESKPSSPPPPRGGHS